MAGEWSVVSFYLQDGYRTEERAEYQLDQIQHRHRSLGHSPEIGVTLCRWHSSTSNDRGYWELSVPGCPAAAAHQEPPPGTRGPAPLRSTPVLRSFTFTVLMKSSPSNHQTDIQAYSSTENLHLKGWESNLETTHPVYLSRNITQNLGCKENDRQV